MSTFRYEDFLKKHVSHADGYVVYTVNEILDVVKEAKDLISKEPMLLRVRAPVTIVGDIHGQYTDLHRIFTMCGSKGQTGTVMRRFLFLGDYVDRGLNSLECICCLLAHKLAFPKMFYLLRGNHEAAPVNREYGLYDELKERFPDQAARLWNALNDLFAYMPLAAVVGGRILCMHGGLSRHLNSLGDILQIKRPLADPTQHALACDLLWADPSPVPSFQGFGPNTERSVSCYFGEDVVAQTCERLKVDIIVRAHQVQLDGCSFFCRRRLITIFSAPMYCKEMNNMGAIMQVTRDLVIGFMLLHVTTPGSAGQEKFVERYRRAEAVSVERSHQAVIARSPAVFRDHRPASSTQANRKPS